MSCQTRQNQQSQCAPCQDSDQPGNLPSLIRDAQVDQSLRCLYEESLGPQLPTERTVKTLIRLGECPGWSESLLGAHSFCWFCHVVAQKVLWHVLHQTITIFQNQSRVWWVLCENIIKTDDRKPLWQKKVYLFTFQIFRPKQRRTMVLAFFGPIAWATDVVLWLWSSFNGNYY